MNSTRNTGCHLYDRISDKEQFCELVLTQDGSLFIDSALRKAVDAFCIYYSGNIYCMQGKERYYSGSLPGERVILPTIVGETTLHSIEDSGYFLHSKQPVLEDGTSAFAVFRYQDLLGLYMADSMVSKAIYFALLEYTLEDESFYSDIFYRMVCRHDFEAAEKVTTWLKLHAANGGEV